IRGYKKNYRLFDGSDGSGNIVHLNNPKGIVELLKFISANRPEIKAIILDDSNYIMAFSNMDKIKEKGYEKFTTMAKEFYDIVKTSGELRDNLKVIFFAHEENIGDTTSPKRKFKTVGKLLVHAITVEGLFTYVFFSELVKDEVAGTIRYCFATNTDGTTTAKTPVGCFDEQFIDNDLAYVVQKIDEYNEG